MHPTPHDAYFKSVLADLDRARELIRLALADASAPRLDLDTLAAEPGSFVDEALREHHVDRLFSAELLGRKIRVYLLYEHKSRPEEWIGLSLLGYQVQIWKSLVKSDPKRQHLPAILSIVIYHGEKGWSVGTRFHDCIDLPREAPPDLWSLVPTFRFLITDLSPAAGEVLVPGALRASTELMLSALRFARTERDLAELIRGWQGLLRAVWREPNGAAAIDLVFRSIAEVRSLRDRDIIDVIAREVGQREARTMQTLIDLWRQEGLTKGLQQGREQGLQQGREQGQRELLLRLLRRRFGRLPRKVLAQIKAADALALERWGDRLFDARTLDELFRLS